METTDNKVATLCTRSAQVTTTELTAKNEDKAASTGMNAVTTKSTRPKPWSAYGDWYWI